MTNFTPSKYFNNYQYQPRQKLLEDLIIQAIRMHGVTIKYLPRENFVKDELFGDHNYAKFNYAFEIEAYVKNVDSFEGQGDIFGKFGLEIKDQITFTVSQRRWDEMNTPAKILDESGDLIELESSPSWVPSSTITFEMEGDNYSRSYPLPRPGDLIYLPMVEEIFEVNIAEHESLFYQHGKLMTYDIKCELFKFSNEEFNTGETEIDAFNDLFGTNQETKTVLDEEGNILSGEEDGTIGLENNDVDENNPISDVDLFAKGGEEYVDFSEKSPFLRKNKW